MVKKKALPDSNALSPLTKNYYAGDSNAVIKLPVN